MKSRQLLGQYITDFNLSQAAHDWLFKETEPIGEEQPITTPIPTSTLLPSSEETTTPEITTTEASASCSWKSDILLVQITVLIWSMLY